MLHGYFIFNKNNLYGDNGDEEVFLWDGWPAIRIWLKIKNIISSMQFDYK